ncbi:MAG: hypothetical protein D3910_17850 [Candidatus Electrothrix sp. ATG2]|nr:hypothetical protein [Candidatus Electrothrix sp. ATG2]
MKDGPELTCRNGTKMAEFDPDSVLTAGKSSLGETAPPFFESYKGGCHFHKQQLSRLPRAPCPVNLFLLPGMRHNVFPIHELQGKNNACPWGTRQQLDAQIHI